MGYKKIGLEKFDYFSSETYFSNRLQFLEKFLGQGDQAKESSASNRFLYLLTESKISGEAKIVVLFLLFCGRYPRMDEVKSLELLALQNDFSSLILHFMNLNEARTLVSNGFPLVLADISDDKILMDVTHTFSYPYNSGIQRVVRKLSEYLRAPEPKVCFVKFGFVDRRLYCMSEQEVDQLISWQNPKVEVKFRNWLSRNKYLRMAKLMIKKSEPLSRIAFRISFWLQSREYTSRKKQSSGAVKVNTMEVPFVWGKKFLVPEVITDKSRVETLNCLFAHFNVDSSMIVYDLIPVYRPEFCELISREFVTYLSLLRYANKVSCISTHVKSQLESFISNINYAHHRKPVIEAHYLGADFSKDIVHSELVESQKPLVCCVGSIDPRKNQRAIMRASVMAMDEGCHFRLLFVGNPGGENDDFLQEMAQLKQRGYDIDIKYSASDEELNEIYRASKFSIFCSLAEGFGLPIVESIYHGKPCLAGDRDSMKEIGEILGGCTFADPESITDIAKEIKRLFEDQDLYKRLCEEAEVAKWPTWQQYSSEVFDFFSRSQFVSKQMPLNKQTSAELR
ncbi:MAG: glycosyltransferase [Pseudobdellovibrionaceae bacterium]|nr:MAG: glycosyltransferase [Pseudobdellovibrionaceae bacterium]